MQSFNEWLYLRDKSYCENFVFIEQDSGSPFVPKVVEYPEGSGRFFWELDDPDNAGKKIHILTSSPNAEKIALEIIKRNKEMRKNAPLDKGAVPGNISANTIPSNIPQANIESSLINPEKGAGRNVKVGGQDMALSSRNVMIKRMIAQQKNTSYSSISDDQANEQLAYMANEEGEKQYMKMDGTKVDLKKIQQAFVDRYGYNPEMQKINGATPEMTRLSPKDWTGIKIQAGKLSPRQQPPKGAIVVPYKPAVKQPVRPSEQENTERYKLQFRNVYGQDISKWQPIARAAVDLSMPGDLPSDAVQQGRFLNYFDEEPNYDRWNDAKRKEVGIDPRIRYKSPNELESESDSASKEDQAKFEKRKKAYEEAYGPDITKWHQSARIAAGLEKPKNENYKNMANFFALSFENRGPKWWEWIPSVKGMSGIMDTDQPASTTQQQQPSAQNPPVNNELNKNEKRLQEIEKELTKIDEELNEIDSLKKLLPDFSKEVKDEELNDIYTKNKEAFDKYASKNNANGINEILGKLYDTNNEKMLKDKQMSLESEASKLISPK